MFCALDTFQFTHTYNIYIYIYIYIYNYIKIIRYFILYLNGKIFEEVYMDIPYGYKTRIKWFVLQVKYIYI